MPKHRKRRATTSRRQMTMSLRVARGRGAAASLGLADAHGIACGLAPNIAPSSCNAGPCYFPDRLLRAHPPRGHGIGASSVALTTRNVWLLLLRRRTRTL